MKNLNEKLSAAAGHTPGPWKVVPRKLCGNDVQGANGEPVIEAGFKLVDSDAILIAAAPDMATRIKELEELNADMLAALESLQVEAWARRSGQVKKDYSLLLADSYARAAIAKAKGI